MSTAIIGLVALQEGTTPGLFQINTGLSIWTLIIFLVLLGVLYKFAYPHILGAVDARERRLREVLEAAARDRAEAERLLEEQRREIAGARQQVQQLIAEGRQAAERTRTEMLDQARREQEELVERTRRELARERELLLAALRDEAVDLSLAAASKLVERRFSADEDRELVHAYLRRAGEADGAQGVA